jgi:hypothetical protein
MQTDSSITVTALDSERIAEWRAIFGTVTVPVRSMLKQEAVLEGIGQTLVYILDHERLSDEQRNRLVAYLAEKFKSLPSAVLDEMLERGIPIRAENTLMSASGDIVRSLLD